MDDYPLFISKIKQKTNIDLSLYKESQMKRRIETLKNKRGHRKFIDYFNELNSNNELLLEFLDKMTINVSEFYRNHKRWEVLEKKILPSLIKDGRKLKVWSAACSTGDEPYTLAMILSKYFPLSQISILATDIDYNVIQKAKIGLYQERYLEEIPEEMKKKFFIKEGDYYKISQDIKKTVTFKQQNLLSDVFDRDYDLIVCRNVMIYFTEDAKEKLYHKFSNSLKKGGYLFVGSTEQIFNSSDYKLESEETFFYQKK